MDNLSIDQLLEGCVTYQPGTSGLNNPEFDSYLVELIKRWHGFLLIELKTKLSSPELACKDVSDNWDNDINEDKTKIEKFLGSLNTISGVETSRYLKKRDSSFKL